MKKLFLIIGLLFLFFGTKMGIAVTNINDTSQLAVQSFSTLNNKQGADIGVDLNTTGNNVPSISDNDDTIAWYSNKSLPTVNLLSPQPGTDAANLMPTFTWSSAGTATLNKVLYIDTDANPFTVGTPYVAFSDYSSSYKAMVIKLNVGNWGPGNNVGFSVGRAGDSSLVIDNKGAPYVAYRDCENSDNHTVHKLSTSCDDTNDTCSMTETARIEKLYSNARKLVHSNPNLSEKLYEEAKKLAIKEKNRFLEAEAIRIISYINRYVGNYDKALIMGNQAIEIYRELKDTLKLGFVYNNFGVIYSEKGDNVKALENYTIAQGYYNTQFERYPNDKKTLVFINIFYTDLAVFYAKKLHQSDKALEHLNFVVENSLKINDYVRLVAARANIGMVYKFMGNIDEALYTYQLALKNATKHNLCQYIPKISNNIAIIYRNRKEYQKSRKYYFSSLENNKIINNNYINWSTNRGIGDTYFEEGKYNKALKFFKDSKRYAVKNNSDIERIESYKCISKTYDKLLQYDSAYYYQDLYHKLEDKYNKEESFKRYEKLRVKYEMGKTETENIILKQDNKLKNEEIEFARKQKLSFILIIIVLMFFILFFIWTIRLKKRNLKQIESLLKQEQYMNDLKIKSKEVEKQYMQELHEADLKFRSSELYSAISGLISKNEVLFDIRDTLKKKHTDTLKNISNIVNSNIDSDYNWQKHRACFDKIHPDFFNKLNKVHPSLTSGEEKLCSFLLMKLTTREIANIMNVTEASVSKNRNRLRKKLNISPEVSLPEFILKIISE